MAVNVLSFPVSEIFCFLFVVRALLFFLPSLSLTLMYIVLYFIKPSALIFFQDSASASLFAPPILVFFFERSSFYSRGFGPCFLLCFISSAQSQQHQRTNNAKTTSREAPTCTDWFSACSLQNRFDRTLSSFPLSSSGTPFLYPYSARDTSVSNVGVACVTSLCFLDSICCGTQRASLKVISTNGIQHVSCNYELKQKMRRKIWYPCWQLGRVVCKQQSSLCFGPCIFALEQPPCPYFSTCTLSCIGLYWWVLLRLLEQTHQTCLCTGPKNPANLGTACCTYSGAYLLPFQWFYWQLTSTTEVCGTTWWRTEHTQSIPTPKKACTRECTCTRWASSSTCGTDPTIVMVSPLFKVTSQPFLKFFISLFVLVKCMPAGGVALCFC